ncbi:MAG: molybdopterin-binding protein [Proteobacteria bacterium]|nr:molybdopterin-binding protein [Pseudomonadota bacterium]MBS0573338.1 molybdopterin-binding protein [Pseudomonadota bacterium]
MNRRGFLAKGVAGASVLGLSGCKVLDGLADQEGALHRAVASANGLSYRAQRLIGGGHTLAPEYAEADIRQGQRPNGSTNPDGAEYLALEAGGWAGYRLAVKGLVERPQSLSLADLRAMPSRTQITRHDCVEGWSCIAKWTGVPLALVLDRAGPQAAARFAVFRCYDVIEQSLAGGILYYESIDMIDARHPQTILAYGMNGADLPVANGAPLRLRVERQLGYKMAKYVHTIELAADLKGYGEGHGSYWADRGYDWYAGI